MIRSRTRGAIGGLALTGVLVLSACTPSPDQATTGDDPPAGSASTSTGSPSASSSTAGGTVVDPDEQEQASDPAFERFYAQELAWEDCEDGFECARLTVPVDYEAPEGDTAELSVIRLPASGDDRQGSIVLNPGGPGGSGIDYARAAETVVSSDVRAAFDVVGFDPRGVGESTPVECLDDEEIDVLVAADGTPDDQGEIDRLVELSQDLAMSCAQNAGALLAHVDTASAARDMDILRAAVGDERLTYLGKSYGTFLGATYAELFPQRVGRLVLDGAIDPSLSSEELNLGQARGFEQALTAFVTDCLEQSDCPLRGSVDEGVQQVQDLLERADARPLDTGTDRELTESLASFGIALPLYESDYWPLLRQGLTAAQSGDGSVLLGFADAYFERGPDGEYDSNAATVIYAVNCLDRPDDSSIADIQGQAQELQEVAPTFGRFLAWGSLPCTYWVPETASQPATVTAEGAAPILVVGTTGDPATPYEWSEGLAEQLESASLLTFDGDGHTAYQRSNNCIDDAVDAYLLSGTMPDDGTVC